MIQANKSFHADVRAVATLTGSYVAGTVFSCDEHNILGLLVKYVKGDETSLQVKVEGSMDGGTTYGQQTTESATGGTITASLAERSFGATGNYWVVIQPIKTDLIRVSVKATDGTPTGTCGIDAGTGWI